MDPTITLMIAVGFLWIAVLALTFAVLSLNDTDSYLAKLLKLERDWTRIDLQFLDERIQRLEQQAPRKKKPVERQLYKKPITKA